MSAMLRLQLRHVVPHLLCEPGQNISTSNLQDPLKRCVWQVFPFTCTFW